MTVTFRAGLYSSLLSAALKSCNGDQKTAKQEARLIQSTLQGIVSDLNLALLIARQWQNIAVRLVFESNTLSKEVKQNLYRNLLYADEEDKRHKYGRNGARKVHQWFLKAVFGTSKKHKKPVNPAGQTHFSQANDNLFGFAPDGLVSDPLTVLLALPDDPYLTDLLHLFSDNEVLGNIILISQKMWYQGFRGRWDEMPDLPSSYLITTEIEEVAAQMDVETASNLTTNFLGYQQKYSKGGVSELLCYLIDMLPLDGREDLAQLKVDIDVDSSKELKKFIEDERFELARMMNVDSIFEHENIEKVDDTRVDMQLALGFSDHKCIQADFLIQPEFNHVKLRISGKKAELLCRVFGHKAYGIIPEAKRREKKKVTRGDNT